MPLYDFSCRGCGTQFEALVAPATLPPCPECGGEAVERLFTPFAGPFTVAPRGQAARRSDAARRVREEQRLQRRAERRAKREDG